MQRRVFDVLVSATGAVMVAVLLVAGGLLLWASTFTRSNVHHQLAAQQISFPPASAFERPTPGGEITPSMIPSVSRYAGQQLTTGAQAKVYADDFIAVHLAQMPYRGVYSRVSDAARAQPSDQALQQEVQTVFRGTTLRGLLLEAYGFSVIGTIAFWASIASFALAAVLALLSGFGFRHARRTPDRVELLGPRAAAGG